LITIAVLINNLYLTDSYQRVIFKKTNLPQTKWMKRVDYHRIW
jgi:hypothetical protein